MHFDRFDICLAYFVFFVLHHRGQGSTEYARLSRLNRYFKPGKLFTETRFLAEESNARDIYHALCEKRGV